MNWLRKILSRSETGAPMAPYDPAKFKNGSTVRVGSRVQLEEFVRTWRYHHKLQPEQLPCAGRIAKVKWSGMYHGGDVVYQLQDVPGIWHETLLEPAQSEDA
jgi:hypothetical protein